MMTFQQLSTLIKQGYTEDQIKQLNAIFSPEDGGGTAPQYGSAPAPTTDTAPSPSPAPAPDNPQSSPAPGTNSPSQQTAPTQEPHGGTAPQYGPETQQRGGTAPQTQQQPESETQKMLKEMLGLMRNGAINTLQQPTTQQVTTESILAKVLEP